MEGTPGLYDTLEQVLRQYQNWVDCRYLKTLAWMIVGVIQARAVRLTAWTSYVQSRAAYVQSHVRRFDRWFLDKRISVHHLYGPLIQPVYWQSGDKTSYIWCLLPLSCGICIGGSCVATVPDKRVVGPENS
jgi:hypothetical protein